MGVRNTIIRTGLETLYFSGAHMLMRPFVGGVGAILMLHHVRPPRGDRFQPNRLLEVTPRFLERVVRHLRRSGVDLVSLDEMHRRMTERDFRRRFACITFDDGYRDNKEFAYPILKAAKVPFAIYVPTSFPDRLGQLWWLALEEVIARHDRIMLLMDGEERRVECASAGTKQEVYDSLYWWLRAKPTEEEILAFVRDLAGRYGVDMAAHCEKLPSLARHAYCGRVRFLQGRTAEAIQILETAFNRGVTPGSEVRGFLGYAYARTGRREEAEKLAVATGPFNQAVIFAGLGDKDRAFEALDRGATAGPFRMGRILTWPELASLRGDPRVKALRKKVGLPE